MAANATSALFPPNSLSPETPFYFNLGSEYIPGVPDHKLSIFGPIVVHWIVAGIFHLLDSFEAPWITRYRIHESAEVTSRNRVTRLEVLRAVIFQQIVQIIMAWLWMDSGVPVVRPQEEMSVLAENMYLILSKLVGQGAAYTFMKAGGAGMIWAMYWWAIPIFQFIVAMFVVDTWQYFLHRAMHMNTTLYRMFHSVHHRLYVPYAFGALYNHPVEGFLLDTLGSAIGEVVAGLSVRQATLFFCVATCKTLDDHCGYSFPWDPLQMFSTNTADYHDIHHQIIGIKSNFSQPFFVHWDIILGTRMTREELNARKAAKGKETKKDE